MLVRPLWTIHLSPETTTLGLVWSPSLGTRERVSSLCKTVSVVAAFLVKERLPQSAVWPGGKMGGSLQATITAVCENKHQATLFFPHWGLTSWTTILCTHLRAVHCAVLVLSKFTSSFCPFSRSVTLPSPA